MSTGKFKRGRNGHSLITNLASLKQPKNDYWMPTYLTTRASQSSNFRNSRPESLQSLTFANKDETTATPSSAAVRQSFKRIWREK